MREYLQHWTINTIIATIFVIVPVMILKQSRWPEQWLGIVLTCVGLIVGVMVTLQGLHNIYKVSAGRLVHHEEHIIPLPYASTLSLSLATDVAHDQQLLLLFSDSTDYMSGTIEITAGKSRTKSIIGRDIVGIKGIGTGRQVICHVLETGDSQGIIITLNIQRQPYWFVPKLDQTMLLIYIRTMPRGIQIEKDLGSLCVRLWQKVRIWLGAA